MEEFEDAPSSLGDRGESRPVEGVFQSHLDERVRPYIDLIDSLRTIGIERHLALPAIAVIGDQSSGKSSVLEALSGVALPRGSGIVTRCPLELKLKKLTFGAHWTAIISYKGESIQFEDPSLVERYVHEAQNKLAGSGVGICEELISLEISSPNMSDLTLIDLPGIARVPVKGQPDNIAEQIQRLIMKFIQRTETIILVVVPCNVDIATTEVLRMAQDVDPEGKRTLAILTKPDLVDRGTERGILEIMKNTVIPLSKGYLIVKCRGQKDINDRISLSEATRRERDFFKNHEYFSVFLKQEKATIQCLASKLTHNLVNHIKSSLPLISEQVRKQLWDTRKELSECEKGPPLDPYQRKSFLITTLTDFNRKIEDLSSGETTSGENMYYEMRAEFAKWKDTLDGANERFHSEMQKVVKEYEHRHRGRELPGFTNYKVFEEVAQEIVAELKGPAICTMKTIKAIVLKTYTDTADRCFSRYPYLLHVSKDKIENIHSKQEAKVEERIEEQIKMEQLVYTQDALYKKSLKETYDSPIDYSKQTNKDRPSVDSEDGTDAVDDRDMVDRSNCPEKMVSYYKIVAQRMADQVPMLISLFMLKEAAQLLCGEMLNLMDGADVREILREDSDISRRRIDMQGRQERLSQAQEKLNNFQ